MYRRLRPLLFCLDAETAHNLVLTLARLANFAPVYRLLKRGLHRVEFDQPTTVMGLEFANPVGLAAGLDKQGSCANAFSALGFGWVELGSVTPLAQPGNPRPRVFRLPEYNALINRMGFNSIGLDAFLANLNRSQPHIIKGINIGKNAATPMALAHQDYLVCLRAVYPHADYVSINVSSPNTQNLRDLQTTEALDALLRALTHERQHLAEQSGRYLPLSLKIGADLAAEQIHAIAALARRHRIDAITATNTTLSRAEVQPHRLAAEPGGLSGRPLADKATEVVQTLYANLQGEIAIIGSGGIDSVAAAEAKFQAGADLIQLYTGFVYHGRALLQAILQQRHFARATYSAPQR